MIFDKRIVVVSEGESRITREFKFGTYDLSERPKKYWYETPKILVIDEGLLKELEKARAGNSITIEDKTYEVAISSSL